MVNLSTTVSPFCNSIRFERSRVFEEDEETSRRASSSPLFRCAARHGAQRCTRMARKKGARRRKRKKWGRVHITMMKGIHASSVETPGPFTCRHWKGSQETARIKLTSAPCLISACILATVLAYIVTSRRISAPVSGISWREWRKIREPRLIQRRTDPIRVPRQSRHIVIISRVKIVEDYWFEQCLIRLTWFIEDVSRHERNWAEMLQNLFISEQ